MANNSEQQAAHDHDGNIKKIGELTKDIEFAMLTTIDENGDLQSRPMQQQKLEFDGDAYFFTYDDSNKAKQVQQNPRVNLAYSSPGKDDYISLAGRGEITHDRQKMEELWQPQLKAWFPDGLETANIALLKVSVTSAEYWDSPSSTIAHAIGLIKNTVTGQAQPVGDNITIQLEK